MDTRIHQRYHRLPQDARRPPEGHGYSGTFIDEVQCHFQVIDKSFRQLNYCLLGAPDDVRRAASVTEDSGNHRTYLYSTSSSNVWSFIELCKVYGRFVSSSARGAAPLNKKF